MALWKEEWQEMEGVVGMSSSSTEEREKETKETEGMVTEEERRGMAMTAWWWKLDIGRKLL